MFTSDRIYEINLEDFNRLFEDSLTALNSGNIKWRNNEATQEEKRLDILKRYETVLAMPNSFMYDIKYENRVVALVIGTIDNENNFVGTLALHGKDLSNSRAWVYNPDVLVVTDTMLTNSGVTGKVTVIQKNGTLKNHLKQTRGKNDSQFSPHHPIDITDTSEKLKIW